MDLHDTIRTYRLFSGSYDIVFGPVFHPGRKEAVRIANDRPGQHILEVGVGTGLSLPHFRADLRVTGIDVSEEMLAKARRRAERLRLSHVEGLHLMDAENLEFPDNSFDAVLALYVASVVPNPARFAAEMRRVCIPGGTIVVVNHFTSENLPARFDRKAPGRGSPAISAFMPISRSTPSAATANCRSARCGPAICSAIGSYCAASTKSPPPIRAEPVTGRERPVRPVAAAER